MKIVEISKLIFEKLKGRIIQFALFKIFGRVIGGFWGFVATEIGGRLLDKALKPAWNWIVRKIFVKIKKTEVKKKGEKVEQAKTENDFDSSFDDLP